MAIILPRAWIETQPNSNKKLVCKTAMLPIPTCSRVIVNINKELFNSKYSYRMLRCVLIWNRFQLIKLLRNTCDLLYIFIVS